MMVLLITQNIIFRIGSVITEINSYKQIHFISLKYYKIFKVYIILF